MVVTMISPHRAPLINITALAVATSVTLLVLYVLCAVVAMALPDIALSHAWLTLFTKAPIGSMWGVIEGIIWKRRVWLGGRARVGVGL